MELINWVLFISASIGFVISVYLIYFLVEEEENNNGIYFSLLQFIAIGILFTTAKEIFNAQTAIWIWRIGNIVSLIVILIYIRVFKVEIGKRWILTTILGVALSVVPFLLNAEFYDFKNQISILTEFNSSYPRILVSFWLPLSLVVIIGLVGYRLAISNSKKEQQNFYRYIIDRVRDGEYKNDKYDDEYRYKNERVRYKEFEDKYFRNVMEEFQYSMDKNRKMNEELYYKQREYWERNMDKLSRNYNIVDNNSSSDRNNLTLINDSIRQLKNEFENIRTKDNSSNTEISHYSNSNSQLFIRELYHFLITPLSQIETKTIIFNENFKEFSKDEVKFKKSLSTIKTSLEICKSVLAAYRELAFVTTSSDWSPESLKMSVVAAAHLYQESLEKQVSLLIELEDSFPAYSNNYLLAIILPLLENAIKACPQNTEVIITNKIIESNIVLSIKNEAINVPTSKQLSTPGYSSKRNHKGTGLQIVRHLVKEQNKGKMNIEIIDNSVCINIIIPNRTENEK